MGILKKLHNFTTPVEISDENRLLTIFSQRAYLSSDIYIWGSVMHSELGFFKDMRQRVRNEAKLVFQITLLIFLFFEQQCFFWKSFFEKKFPKKHLKKKKENTFFQKDRVLVYWGKKQFFSPKRAFFLEKIKCQLNCPFSKMFFFSFALQLQSVCGLLLPVW